MAAYKQSATAAEIKAAFNIAQITEDNKRELIETIENDLTHEEVQTLTDTIIKQIPNELNLNRYDKFLLAMKQAYIAGFYTAADLAQEANNTAYYQLFGNDEHERGC